MFCVCLFTQKVEKDKGVCVYDGWFELIFRQFIGIFCQNEGCSSHMNCVQFKKIEFIRNEIAFKCVM